VHQSCYFKRKGLVMEAVTGVFQTRETAERALSELRNTGIPEERITLLTPGTVDHVDKEIREVPRDTTEQPGMGNAMGALLGGSVGFTGGSVLMALIPGLGPVTALGLLGAGILGAAGATIGGTAAGRIEKASYQGLPEDEIFIYEDCLRHGQSVVVALAENDGQASVVRDLLKQVGADSVDAARERWWTGLRSAEQEHCQNCGKDLSQDEKFYRMGFEAALHARTRCMEFDQVSAEMDASLADVRRQFPGENVEEPFTRGYQRGREHYQRLCDEAPKAA
jgi:hypothetical protein